MGHSNRKSAMKIELLRELIAEHEEWLMESILEYAKARGYAQYTSTLREAWRLSISGLSNSLLAAIGKNHPNLELNPDETYISDPIAEFGIIEARRHRERGVSLGMFLGLMKYYRQSYKDLVRHGGFVSRLENHFLNLIERFFDRLEIAFCLEWAESDQSELIEKLQVRNRLMTNEKNRYLTIFESHPHMVLILDKDLKLINLNHAAAKRFQAQEIPGEHYYQPAPEQSTDKDPPQPFAFENTATKALEVLIPSLIDDLQTFIAGGETHQSFEKEIVELDEKRYLNVSFSQVLDVSEKFSGVVVTLEDITTQKQATEELRHAKEAADAANRAKSAFIANMSHELRTPMNAVLGYAQLMQKDSSLQGQQREYLNTISRSGAHLLALINNVLAISRIEVERTTLELVTVDLHTLLRDMEAMFRLKTNAKGLHFEVIEADEFTRYVVADESKLRQVLINLLGNAVKFVEEGSIIMRVAVTTGPQGGMRLVTEVEDTGPGIAPDELGKVFGYFEQTATGKKRQSGSGLGMTISRGFARLMGGDLTVTSREGEGSTFRFEIDVHAGQEDIREKTHAPLVMGLTPGQTVPRVLVVDDDEENRKLLVRLLELAGFKVQEAENGEKAVALFAQWSPQFIWMDMRMPVMDGLEATRRIRTLPGGDQVKIVAFTASVMEEERTSILAARCDDVVHKPYRESLLFEVMAKHLGVNYHYEENSSEIAIESETDMCSLTTLPAGLRDSLTRAVLELDTDRTLAVVEEITRQDAAIGPVLRKLAENLEYERLLTMLEQNDGRSVA
jgi:signal transduction histidine kinase/DNA-binding response OmpR family regulator